MAARKSGNAASAAAASFAETAETAEKEAGQDDETSIVLADEITVKTRRGLTTFRRAGLRFGKEPVTLKTADLGDEQIAALLAEANLVIAEV
tara:strand:- start:170 stop:445 length:276 start_codon:yes stop_codon:yes gene_type:complete